MTQSALYEAAISQLGYEGSNINNRVLRCFSKVIKLFSISLLKTRYQPNTINTEWHGINFWPRKRKLQNNFRVVLGILFFAKIFATDVYTICNE